MVATAVEKEQKERETLINRLMKLTPVYLRNKELQDLEWTAFYVRSSQDSGEFFIWNFSHITKTPLKNNIVTYYNVKIYLDDKVNFLPKIFLDQLREAKVLDMKKRVKDELKIELTQYDKVKANYFGDDILKFDCHPRFIIKDVDLFSLDALIDNNATLCRLHENHKKR